MAVNPICHSERRSEVLTRWRVSKARNPYNHIFGITAFCKPSNTTARIIHLCLAVVFLFSLSACSPAAAQVSATASPFSRLASLTGTHTLTLTSTPTDTATPTASLTPTATSTPTPTPIPPVQSLRAKVSVAGRLACRFGPGVPYLFKYSFSATANIELVGRMEFSHWVLARAIGGTNRCWVNGGPDYLLINGDPLALPVADPHIVLPWSDYYGPMSNVSATRSASRVTVTYSGIVLVPASVTLTAE